jgi:site-specific recombinase XerD
MERSKSIPKRCVAFIFGRLLNSDNLGEIPYEQKYHGLRRLLARDIQRMLDKLAHSASGLEPEEVTPHKLRHTFGKSLVDAGVSLDRVAVLMGHQDLATTAIYTTPSRADLAAAVEKIACQE